MSIQFACPGCSQPIEVDDAHAGRNALCPYCRREVTVPAASTYAAAAVTARPTAPPPTIPGTDPTYGYQQPYPATPRLSNPYATWALAMVISVVLCWIVIFAGAIAVVMPHIPMNGTPLSPAETKELEETVGREIVKRPEILIPAILIPIFSIVGVALAIAGLVRGGAPVRSWISLIVCGLFVTCLGLGFIANIGSAAAGG